MIKNFISFQKVQNSYLRRRIIQNSVSLFFELLILTFIYVPLVNAYTVVGEKVVAKNDSKKIVVTFLGEVNETNIDNLIHKIDVAVKQYYVNKIDILISSTGGSTSSALTAYNYIKALPESVTVKTHNLGVVASAAILIYCAGSERSSYPISQFLIHESTVTENSNYLTARYLRETYEWNEAYNEISSQIIAFATNKNISDINKIIFDGKTFNPVEAKNLGLVHKIEEISIDRNEIIIPRGW